jgi:hypothetical protein
MRYQQKLFADGVVVHILDRSLGLSPAYAGMTGEGGNDGRLKQFR